MTLSYALTNASSFTNAKDLSPVVQTVVGAPQAQALATLCGTWRRLIATQNRGRPVTGLAPNNLIGAFLSLLVFSQRQSPLWHSLLPQTARHLPYPLYHGTPAPTSTPARSGHHTRPRTPRDRLEIRLFTSVRLRWVTYGSCCTGHGSCLGMLCQVGISSTHPGQSTCLGRPTGSGSCTYQRILVCYPAPALLNEFGLPGLASRSHLRLPFACLLFALP